MVSKTEQTVTFRWQDTVVTSEHKCVLDRECLERRNVMSKFCSTEALRNSPTHVAPIYQMKVKIAMRSRAVLNNAEVCSNVSAILGVCVLLLLGAATAFAQAPAPAPARQVMTDTADQDKQLADQITGLRAQIARLETAVHETGPGKKVNLKPAMKMSPSPNNGMGIMDDKSETSMPPEKGAMTAGAAAMDMKGDQTEMGGMSPGGNAAMNAMPPPVGRMATMSAPSSAATGQAGAPHLYHIGSNGFFLTHSRHIRLTQDQSLTLKQVKEKAMLNRASEQRKISQAEQELYEITGANQPDETRIETKIVEIEKLRADERTSFIHAVADASSVLTAEQRTALETISATRK
jgi:Spy/CpxP family protein refolding chaperone